VQRDVAKGYTQEDSWIEIIESYLTTKSVVACTSAQILEDCLDLAPAVQTRGHQVRIGLAMQSLGWTKKRITRNTKQAWVYVSPRASEEQLAEWSQGNAVRGPWTVEGFDAGVSDKVANN
jgi:hypothetical protein